MRLAVVLCRQHGDRMFKRHWLVQGRRVPHDTGAKEILESKGIPVLDAVEYTKIKQPLPP